MKIFKPQAITEIGKRKNQEDSIFPSLGNATVNDRLFLVCDGMGGHESGEVASNSVCNSISSFLNDVNPDTISVDVFREALIYAYDQLDQIDSASQNTQRKMGTTLTFLYLGNKKTIIAHIGDSRVYQLRHNENNGFDIIHKTNDHSWVSLLIRNGEITEEEAKTHPLKNQITRAIQPNIEERCKATVYETSDVKAGDYFFLCSDGVLESVSDALLQEIIADNCSDEEKIIKIKEICAQYSRDNNSAYLIHIEEGTDIINSNECEELIVSNTVEVDPNKPKAAEQFVLPTIANEATMNAQNNNMPMQSVAPSAQNLTQNQKVKSKGGDKQHKQKRPFSKGVIAGLVAAIILCIGGGILCINSIIDDNKKEKQQKESKETSTPTKEDKEDSTKEEDDKEKSDNDKKKETITIEINRVDRSPQKASSHKQQTTATKNKNKVNDHNATKKKSTSSKSNSSNNPPKKDQESKKLRDDIILAIKKNASSAISGNTSSNGESSSEGDHVQETEKANK